MPRKIKFHTFHFLFRLFAYLADKSGGWRLFVNTKLLLGSLILGLGLNGCGEKTESKQVEPIKTETLETCYKTFIKVDAYPEFKGGEKELLHYIDKNLKYPESAIATNIQGKVIVRFLVTKTGTVDSVEVLKSLNPACDKEAVRVIKNLPKFTPGRQEGKIIPVWFTIPITFKPTN